MRSSIRYQILGLIGAIIAGALGTYLLLATTLFTDDKVAYLYDFNSQLSGTLAEEVQAHLQAQVDRLRYFGAESTDVTAATRALLTSDEQLIGVEVWQKGPEGFTQAFSHVEQERLEAVNLAPEDLAEARREFPPSFEVIAADQVALWNASLPPDLAVLRLGTITAAGDRVVVADFRPERLLRVFSRPQLATVYLVDARGRVLVHPDPAAVISHQDRAGHPLVRMALEGRSERGVSELSADGQTVIGAYAAVPLARLALLLEVPKARALEAAYELGRRSILFAVFVLAVALLASIYFSRRLTAPLRALEEKMAVISQGEFGVQVPIESRNEIGRLGQAFNRMSAELANRDALLMEAHAQLVQSEKLSALGEMSAGLAHEVKNPMVGIVGFSELGEGAESLSEAREFFQLIRADAHRANEILQNLLEFARPERVELERLDLNEVVRGAVRLVAHQLAIGGVKIATRYGGALPPIQGNANQLRQVLVNLMMNAAHAMEGEPRRDLTISTEPQAGSVVIEVRDTGRGMTDEVLRKLFHPFFTTKPKGKGTGLGLSVSRSIVLQHKGEITVSSAEGQGAAFRIRLPAMVEERARAGG